MHLTILVLNKRYELGGTAKVHVSQDKNHTAVFTAFGTALFLTPFSAENNEALNN